MLVYYPIMLLLLTKKRKKIKGVLYLNGLGSPLKFVNFSYARPYPYNGYVYIFISLEIYPSKISI